MKPKLSWWAHVLVGTLFGILVTKAEVISWFRIQEMFRFQGFHMYGVIGSAVAVGALSLWILRKARLKTIRGETIAIPPKDFGTGVRVAVGGILFGLGWGLTGACPGPIYALIGNGVTVMAVVLASALAGTWVYGFLKPHLPH
jgi:uncharacterized membrane protein YedE/YeeE